MAALIRNSYVPPRILPIIISPQHFNLLTLVKEGDLVGTASWFFAAVSAFYCDGHYASHCRGQSGCSDGDCWWNGCSFGFTPHNLFRRKVNRKKPCILWQYSWGRQKTDQAERANQDHR